MPAFTASPILFSFLRVACLAAVLAGVSGCERQRADPPAAPAQAPAADPKALMAIAFPGWLSDQNHVVAAPVKDEVVQFIVVAPSLVVPLAGDRVVLVVEGTPSDEQGNSVAGHVSRGNLGAYWFARKDGQWTQTAAQPSVALTGFSGEVGRLQRVELGGGKIALAVTNGSCWQGQCGEWLSLYELGEQHADDLLGEDASVMLHSDALGATEACEELTKLAPGATRRVMADAYSQAVGCYDVTGEWSIVKGEAPGAAPGDLVVRFKGVQTDVEAVPKAASKPSGKARPKPVDPEPTGDDEGVDANEYLATVRAVDAVLTYRYEKGRYVKASGENPAPGI